MDMPAIVQQPYDEAEACFEETRMIAHRLGVKWSAYGYLADSACVLLEWSGGDPERHCV
ncbi:MAG: hypothetical protein ACRCUT_14995 [Spirochaetota bacterium]